MEEEQKGKKSKNPKQVEEIIAEATKLRTKQRKQMQKVKIVENTEDNNEAAEEDDDDEESENEKKEEEVKVFSKGF